MTARWLGVLLAAGLSLCGAASAAEVRVMISSGFHGVYSELAPAFERASGHHVDLAQRATLLAATSIASSDSGSGTFLATVLFPQLGIAEQVAATAAREE
jgi:hypothetical protein